MPGTQTLQQISKTLHREAGRVSKQKLDKILGQIEQKCRETLGSIGKLHFPTPLSFNGKLIVRSVVSLLSEGSRAISWDVERLASFSLQLRSTNHLIRASLWYVREEEDCMTGCSDEWRQCLRRIDDCSPDSIFRLCGLICDISALGCNVECISKMAEQLHYI